MFDYTSKISDGISANSFHFRYVCQCPNLKKLATIRQDGTGQKQRRGCKDLDGSLQKVRRPLPREGLHQIVGEAIREHSHMKSAVGLWDCEVAEKGWG